MGYQINEDYYLSHEYLHLVNQTKKKKKLHQQSLDQNEREIYRYDK